MGWRYSHHFAPLHDSDLILVTEHGWTDFLSRWAGHEPRSVSTSVPPPQAIG